MITINLLAPGKRRPTRLAPTGILPILGIGAVIFVLVMFSASTRAQLNAVNKQLEALGPVTQQVQKLEQTIATLKARQGQLSELLAMQLPASVSLDALKTVIPRDVWVTSVTTQEGRNVVFDGYTFTYKSVAQFMVALRESERFRNIDLTTTQKDHIGLREVVKFTITGELVAGPPKTGGAPQGPAPSRPGPPSQGHAPLGTGDTQ
ncbi:MAG: PilN domain-containing protein [Bacillati bacterium ANGP1]|uniref:PilN domain-containing protein n=1 Tax=Candidatus Segetimicrobium genomatis TaxID=2569760 RepID=A0A537LWI3_9BACT|nr:MAG: PilN domain-containing protein [Terrabacteria group bacterium ANGP1]